MALNTIQAQQKLRTMVVQTIALQIRHLMRQFGNSGFTNYSMTIILYNAIIMQE